MCVRACIRAWLRACARACMRAWPKRPSALSWASRLATRPRLWPKQAPPSQHLGPHPFLEPCVCVCLYSLVPGARKRQSGPAGREAAARDPRPEEKSAPTAAQRTSPGSRLPGKRAYPFCGFSTRIAFSFLASSNGRISSRPFEIRYSVAVPGCLAWQPMLQIQTRLESPDTPHSPTRQVFQSIWCIVA